MRRSDSIWKKVELSWYRIALIQTSQVDFCSCWLQSNVFFVLIQRLCTKISTVGNEAFLLSFYFFIETHPLCSVYPKLGCNVKLCCPHILLGFRKTLVLIKCHVKEKIFPVYSVQIPWNGMQFTLWRPQVTQQNESLQSYRFQLGPWWY